MTRIERKLLIQTSILGSLLTVAVAGAHYAGLLMTLENWLYDRRARDCQFFATPPTDTLVHLDVDDHTIEAIGRWPWPRSLVADLIDEMHWAGAKTIALDIIFPDPAPGDDAKLAEAIRRHGRVVIPMSLGFEPATATSHIRKVMLEELQQDPELSKPQLRDRLETRGFAGIPAAQQIDDEFSSVQRTALYRRIDQEADSDAMTTEQLAQRILPKVDLKLGNTPIFKQLQRQHAVCRSIHALQQFAVPVADPMPPLLPTTYALPPVPVLAEATSATGFVDYVPDPDGVLRSVPLFKKHGDWAFPQMGLALACRHMGVAIQDVRILPDKVVIPKPEGGDIVIPVRHERIPKFGDVGLFMDIPWFGPTDNWKLMYDYPNHARAVRHEPLMNLWLIHNLRHRIINNNQAADRAISNLLDDGDDNEQLDADGKKPDFKFAMDPEKFEAYARKRPPPEDTVTRLKMARWVLKELSDSGWLEAYKYHDGEEALSASQMQVLPIDEKNFRVTRDRFWDAYRALNAVLDQNEKLGQDLARMSEQVRDSLQGRAVLVGWIATSIAADSVPTSLHRRCPGVVVHGALYNALVTQEFWRRAPPWTSLVLTIAIGVCVTLATGFLSPLRAMLTSLAIGIGYLVANGIILFDKYNLIVNAAGPLVAAAVVWSGCTVFRFVGERLERARITRRFRSYVDPALVDYVIEHPEQAQLDGQIRELTVVFTDLAGFTRVSEQLRERTVAVLNQYMELMVPIIRRHNGYVNKFLGDGIMFFYGAPQRNCHHARDAVLTTLKMQDLLADFNLRLAEQDLPAMKMRTGISSGNMVVGDAGSADASDYTVIGDAVNLGARLESANKATGTWILINDRAAMLIEDRFLLRPIGRLQVVGKSQGVMTYEPLGLAENANEDQKRLVELTDAMVNAYILSQFDQCIDRAHKLDEAYGPSELTAMYIRISERYLAQSPPLDFVGQIILEDK